MKRCRSVSPGRQNPFRPQEPALDFAQVLLQYSVEEILELLIDKPVQVLDLSERTLGAVQTEKLAEVLRSAKCPAMGLSLRNTCVDSLKKLLRSNIQHTPLTGLDLRGVVSSNVPGLRLCHLSELSFLFHSEHSRMTSLDVSGHGLAGDHFEQFKNVLEWMRSCPRMERLSANDCAMKSGELRRLAETLFKNHRRAALTELNLAGNGHACVGGRPEDVEWTSKDESNLNFFFRRVGRSRSLQVLDVTGVVPVGHCLPAILRMLQRCTTLRCLRPEPDVGPSPTAEAVDTLARIRRQLARNATTRLDRAMAVALCLKSRGLPRDLVMLNAQPFLHR